MQQAPAAVGQPVLPGLGAGLLNLFGNSPTTPDANTLISLKLLSETNPAAFKQLANDSTRWLAGAIALIKKDPYLKVKLGGNLLQSSMMLADILKANAERVHFEDRLKSVTKEFYDYEMKFGLQDALPVAKAQEVFHLKNAGIHKGQLQIKVGGLGKAIFYN